MGFPEAPLKLGQVINAQRPREMLIVNIPGIEQEAPDHRKLGFQYLPGHKESRFSLIPQKQERLKHHNE